MATQKTSGPVVDRPGWRMPSAIRPTGCPRVFAEARAHVASHEGKNRECRDGRGGIWPAERPGQRGCDEAGKSEGEEPGRGTVGEACAQRGVVVI